jgi:hypothetical protein
MHLFAKIIFITSLLATKALIAQKSTRHLVLDSINHDRESDKGAFNLYIKKPEFEIIVGAFRNRDRSNQGFQPINFTYNVFLPFQYDLNYVHLKAKDKLLKINSTFIIHHSKYGNYALGIGGRFSFLIIKKMYISYQIGVVWCEPVKRNSNDGINNMGFNLHHQFGLNYNITKHFKTSLNVVHLSSGNLFKNVNNNQDVVGVGISYSF